MILHNFFKSGLACCAFFCGAAIAAPVGAPASDEALPTAGAALLDTNGCRPAYPRVAMQRGEQGTVKMQFTVGVNGGLVGSAIVKSSGFRDLDQAALNALIHCRFKPAYRNGKAVQAAFTMDYVWQLQSQQ